MKIDDGASMLTVDVMQRELCARYFAEFVPAPLNLKVGISLNVQEGVVPVHGMRHPPAGDTTGWYIYAGDELSLQTDFFQPLHLEHLNDWCPNILKYLGLPPGWRFLVAENYEDVWFDEALLH
mgnify:CR=1 FL=1